MLGNVDHNRRDSIAIVRGAIGIVLATSGSYGGSKELLFFGIGLASSTIFDLIKYSCRRADAQRNPLLDRNVQAIPGGPRLQVEGVPYNAIEGG